MVRKELGTLRADNGKAQVPFQVGRVKESHGSSPGLAVHGGRGWSPGYWVGGRKMGRTLQRSSSNPMNDWPF